MKSASFFKAYVDRDLFGGGCFFNGAAVAIQQLKERYRVQKFAVVDTDAHHGDGTWALFKDDPDVLYVCFCAEPTKIHNQNINIQVPSATHDDNYLLQVKTALEERIKTFVPEIIFWNWGYDGTIGEYGDIGLTAQLHVQLAQEIKRFAVEICNGRLVVILCGGSRRDLAASIIPRILEVLVRK